MKVNIDKKIEFINIKSSEIINSSSNINYPNLDGKVEILISDLNEGKNIFKIDEEISFKNQIIYIDEKYIYAYKTRKNNLVILKSPNLMGNSVLIIDKLKYSNKEIILKNHASIINDNEKINRFILIERKTKLEFSFNIVPGRPLLIDPKDITVDGNFDIFVEILVSNKYTYMKRVGKYRYRKEIFLKDCEIESDDKVYIISPYTTYKAKYLTIKKSTVNLLEYNVLNENLRKEKDIWLIGEQPFKAQDNGYYFFKYCRENFPDQPIYYVIEKESKDYEKVALLGNVIEFGTKKHFELIARAKYLISTHHDEYLFPYQSKKLIKKIKAKRIFLQHGVMGTKYMANFYGKNAQNFRADMFVVSSEREKEMIINDFGFSSRDVKVTGLPRFDNLFKEIPLTNEVAIIPTWRDWLVSSDDFENTEYFQRYISLVQKIKENGFDVVFILHINMAKYKDKFEKFSVRTFTPEELDVQEILKNSKLLITDYSSVSFDFAFLKKPVIYYQFDQDKFFGINGSHYDIETELPGNIATSEIDVISNMLKYRNNEYKVFETKKIEKLCSNFDTNNSKRVYEAIISEEYGTKQKWYKTTKYQKIFNFYRRSEIYFPSMKLFYNIASRLPKKNIVLLESSNGKNISDSPLEIYKAWTKIDPDQQFVFSYNYVLPHKYKGNAKAVKRLSPEYFYYMARSKYWINNQNFPYYFKNRNTTYLQTWHGTPIKKMLHDIENIVGRDAGYTTRVSKAIKNWTYLLTPSEYSTECFKSAFRFDCEVLEFGYPRNDILLNEKTIEENRRKIIEKYGIEENKKVILFAPTFRDNGRKIKGKYEQDLFFDFEEFNMRYGDDYCVLFKLHFLAKPLTPIPDNYGKTFINVTSHDEINELFSVADILVTDYSSIMFDFLITQKKTILYAHDLYDYEFNNRGFYLDYKKESPGKVVETFEELLSEIEKEDFGYNYDLMANRYTNDEKGDAATKTVAFLLGLK